MKFSFFIGGYFDGHFELRLKGTEMKCFVFDSPAPRQIKPNHSFKIEGDPDWENLVTFLKRIRWKSEYNAPILDGTQWSLEFSDGIKYLNINGSNAYPRNFKVLLKLIDALCEKYGISRE